MSRHPAGRDDTQLDADTFAQAIDGICAKVKLSRDFDIPYLAGYSRDGQTIYFDQRLPAETFDRFLILHEAVEKSLLELYQLTYQHAHQVALQCERAAVLASGLDWDEYNGDMQKHIHAALEAQIMCVPPDLDLEPYVDECDRKVLAKIRRATGGMPDRFDV